MSSPNRLIGLLTAVAFFIFADPSRGAQPPPPYPPGFGTQEAWIQTLLHLLYTGSGGILNVDGSGAVGVAPQCASGGVKAVVASQGQLSALSTANLPCVELDSLTAPPVVYLASAGSCTIPGGDGGSQLVSANSKCWLLAPQTTYDIRTWGLTSNPINLYVNLTGNNYGGGNFCAVSSKPCATIGQAAAMAYKFCTQGGYVVVNIAAGSFAETIFVAGPLQCSGIVNGTTDLQGSFLLLNGAGAGSTFLTGNGSALSTIDTASGAFAGVENMTLSDSVTGAADVWVEQNSTFSFFGGVTLGATSGQLVHVEEHSFLNFWNSINVSGGSAALLSCAETSFCQFNPLTATITFTGSPAFSSALFISAYNSAISVGTGWSFSGTVTGPRFYVDQTSSIDNETGGPLPGNAGGRFEAGGVVDPGTVPTVVENDASLGTGGTIAMASSSNDYAGAVLFTTGSGSTAASGNYTVTFGNSVTGRQCTTELVGVWVAGATKSFISTVSATAFTLKWVNVASTLTTGSSGYGISYTCQSSY